MALGGDPNEIRGLAARAGRAADQVIDHADRLLQTADVEWTGKSAERFHQLIGERRREALGAAGKIGEAERALRHLADTLEERQAAIARAMTIVDSAIDNARNVIGNLADKAWDALTGAQRAAGDAADWVLKQTSNLPPPGDPRWLELASKVAH